MGWAETWSAPDPDDAYEIGATPLQTLATAMRIGPGADGLCYLGEEAIRLAMIWRIVEDKDGRRHRWWRLEAKAAVETGRIRPGHELVVALHPYGSGWVNCALFKPGSKKAGYDRPDVSMRRFASVDEAAQVVERLRYDYWEKGNYLTAGVSQPQIPLVSSGIIRNVQQHAAFVFGVCERFSNLEQELLGSHRAQSLLRTTAEGTLRFWAPRAKLTIRPRLCDEVKMESIELMILAVRQALAGPHRDGDRWVGRPVVDKVDQIYRGHLNRRNRVLAKNIGRLSVYDDERLYDHDMSEPFEDDARMD